MSTDNRNIQLGVTVDGTSASAGFSEIKQGAKDMAQAVAASGEQAAKGVDKIGSGSDVAAQRLDKATSSIVGSVQRATAAMQAGERGSAKYFETLASQRGADLGVLKPYLDQLRQVEAAQKAASGSLGNIGTSAKQTAAALRGVPAQFTDIITSLQGGQAPLTVFLQQGGQLKDMFGGAGNAAKALGGYVVGLINPFTIAAAAAGALGYAYFKGSGEAEEFNKQLILTGRVAGVTSGQLMDQARAIGSVAGTQGQAAEVLAQLVGTGRVARDSLQGAGEAIVGFSRASGIEVKNLVNDFAELGKAPADAIYKLNEQYNFLTAATYQQIAALEQEGRKEDAAALAQKTYAEAIKDRSADIVKSLGSIERAWLAVSKASSTVIDDFKNIGRPESIAGLKTRADIRDREGGDSSALRREIAQLEAQALKDSIQAEKDRVKKLAENAGSEATKAIEEQRKALMTGAQKVETELKAYRDRINAIRLVTPNSPLLDPKQIAADEAAIREKGVDKGAARQANKEATEAQRALEKYRNLVSDLGNEQSGLSAGFNEQVSVLIKGWKMSGDAVEVYDRAYGQLLAKQPFAIQAAKELAEAEKQYQEERKKRFQEVEKQYDQEVKAAENSAKSVADRVLAMREEEEAMSRALLLNISLAQALEDVRIARLEDARAQAAAGGEQERVDEINKEIAARKELAGLNERKAKREADTSDLKAFLGKDIKTDYGAGFDKASQSLGVFVETFGGLIDAQEKYNRLRKTQGITSEQIAKLDTQNARMQINSYATLAGAARGFFGEKTAGYKALMVAEQTLRAIELAGSLASIGRTFAEGSAKAVLGVVNQANGDPYSAFPRMAAMAAIMAGLGFAVSGAFGGGSKEAYVPLNTGTGTVFGDSSKASESITKSIDRLKDVDLVTMHYSGEMLASLRNIESALSGVAGQIIRNGSYITGSSFVGGTTLNRQGITGSDPTIGIIGSTIFDKFTKGVFDKVNSLIFGKTTTSLADAGVQFASQTLDSILSGGVSGSGYQTVETKKKALFGLVKSSSTSTSYSGLDANLTNQFTNLIRDTYNSVIEANQALGIAAQDTSARIAGLTVNLGRISLKGLSGDQIQERLTAVFGAFADNLALSANSSFVAFQKSGEGYFETLVRVASGFETATTLLDKLGVSAVALSSITRTQGDVAAELVRQSLQATEGLSGVADVLGVIDGTAQEIADAYTALTDARTSLRLLGLDGGAVGLSLLQGAGGLDALGNSIKAFEEGFYTDSQQIANNAERLSIQFSRLGLSLPASGGDFVSLVKGIDTSTEAGQKLLGSVLGLSGGFSDLLNAIKDTTSGIADEIARIKGLSSTSAGKSFAQLQSEFAINTAQARSGDQAAIDLLPSISQALLKAAEATAGSSLDVAVIQAQTLASLQATLDAISDPTKRLKGFASGGDFSGGWRIVGENGPELEATGSARIFNSDQTARILRPASSDADMLAELRDLRREVAGLRDDQRIQAATIAGNTGKAARILESVTPDGNSLATTAV